MDSFLSLFDPSDSQTKTANKKRHKPEQDNVKKKVEAPSKGRKRGRRSQVKNETLPEESSFLCEPDLSNEVLVKDGSYIESYFEVNRAEEETLDEDTRPKRRNSRKGRRRKNKVSPAKDLTPNFGWDDESDADSQGASLNNHFFKPKVADDQIGKNVNDLKNEDRERHRPKIGSFEEREVYNVIDKLEKVSLKDDVYMAGDFDADDLENDVIYNSDEVEESFDDTASDASDSEEAYGSLPPEPRFGNVEYKLQLVAPCERRFQHLVTQLKWRLRSGGGCAVYVVGVRDCGALRGLRPRALRATLRTLARMAAALTATVNHCSVRRVAPHRAVAEIYIRKLADAQQSVELRVAVMGANEAGKSTLIGVLTQGELDNGRGSARLNMFRHLHEVKSGRTSSLSHEILGFDAQGNVVNYGCSELMTAERIGERSARLVSFLDLAGHSKYQRTTVHGLTGYCPHYAMLVISATAGITPITEEHLGLVLALDLPLFVVITKAELSAAAVPPLVERLRELLAPAGKKPLLITDEQSARSCVAPQPLILDAIDRGAGGGEMHDPHSSVAVFPVSCVRGGGLRALHAGLLALSVPVQASSPDAGAGARPDDEDADDADAENADEERCEFQIDEIFHVGDSGGPVVGGLMVRGQLREGDRVVVGPLENGDFIPIVVKSIHRNRVPHGSVRAGQSASLGLCGASRPRLRPGQAVLAAPGPRRGPRPVFARCGKHRHTAEFATIIQGGQHHDNAKNRKNVRRKNKNLLQDLAKVENSLIKNNEIQPANFYKSDSESDKREMDNTNTRRKDSDGDTANELDNSGRDAENNLRYKNRKNSAKDSRVFDDSIEDANVKNIDTKLNNTTKDSTKYNTKDENLIVKNTNVNVEEKWSTIDKRKETQDAKVCKSESDGDAVGKEDENDVACTCHEMVPLEDPNDPRGCLYFQATMHVLRHPTAIKPGFQCTVHAGNVRQTAIIEGILSGSGSLLAGSAAAALFRFARCPEYLAPGRRLLLTAGLGTRAIGRVTQVFPYFP